MKESGLRWFSLLLRVVWIKGVGPCSARLPPLPPIGSSPSFHCSHVDSLQIQQEVLMLVCSLAPHAEHWQQVFTLQMPWLQFFFAEKKTKKNTHTHMYIYTVYYKNFLYSPLYSWQGNCDASPSCSRGVCWRSYWISMSGTGRRLPSSAPSCSPCWSCCRREEPRLPSVSDTPGFPRRPNTCILLITQGRDREVGGWVKSQQVGEVTLHRTGLNWTTVGCRETQFLHCFFSLALFLLFGHKNNTVFLMIENWSEICFFFNVNKRHICLTEICLYLHSYMKSWCNMFFLYVHREEKNDGFPHYYMSLWLR